MLKSSLIVLLLLPIPAYRADVDGPSEDQCTQCDKMGSHLRFSAHLTVWLDGQNETTPLMPTGATVRADCTSASQGASPSMLKVLVIWETTDAVSTGVLNTREEKGLSESTESASSSAPTTTAASDGAPRTILTIADDMSLTGSTIADLDILGSVSTRGTGNGQLDNYLTTVHPDTTRNTPKSADDTSTTETGSTIADLGILGPLSTQGAENGQLDNDLTTLPSTTVLNLAREQEAVVSTTESSTTQISSTLSVTDETSFTLTSTTAQESTSTETVSDSSELLLSTSNAPLSTTLYQDVDSTTLSETSTFDISSTTLFTESTLHDTETSISTTFETSTTSSIISTNTETATGAVTFANTARSLETDNHRFKRSAEMLNSNRNEIIFYFKEDNTTYYLNKVVMIFSVASLGTQYVQYEGLHRWITPIGYAYECSENVSFALKNATLTLENMKVAAFIPSSCKFPAQSFMCGSQLPQADTADRSDPTISGVLIAGMVMGGLSLLGVVVIVFRRCCKWRHSSKPRQLTL